jgi:hypothetical protein
MRSSELAVRIQDSEPAQSGLAFRRRCARATGSDPGPHARHPGQNAGAHRLEKFLESTGIKLSATVSDMAGASSRAMLEALINGERDPEKLARLARNHAPAGPQNR